MRLPAPSRCIAVWGLLASPPCNLRANDRRLCRGRVGFNPNPAPGRPTNARGYPRRRAGADALYSARLTCAPRASVAQVSKEWEGIVARRFGADGYQFE